MVILATGIDQNSLGVTVGDKFNVEVLENPKDSMTDNQKGDFTQPKKEGLTRPKDQKGSSSFSFFGNIELENFNLAPVIEPLPSTGTVFTIKVLAVPTETEFGKISVTVRGSTKNYDTDFSFGSPIIYTDWDGWIEVLSNIEENTTDISDNIGSASVDIITNSATSFQSKITFTMVISEEKKAFIEEMKIIQEVGYDKTTGIQDSILVEFITTTSKLGEMVQMVQKVQLGFTTKAATLPDYSSLLFMIGLGGMTVLGVGAFILNRRRYETKQVNKDLVGDIQKKTMENEKSQLQDIQERIAEIEKREKINLEKAETSLKDTKKFRRRR